MAPPVDDLGDDDPNDAPMTTNGFGPPPLPELLFPAAGLDGVTTPWLGEPSSGASPLKRALIRLGFSCRTKAASSASGSASFAISPPSAAASLANFCRRSAASSTS